MSSFKVTVEKLTVSTHPNADLLELAQVGLYRAVIPKGVYNTNDYAVYIPEQGVLPDSLIEELGLVGKLAGKAKNRVKAVRLRGEISQGIACRPTQTNAWDEHLWEHYHQEQNDLSDMFGIEKWVPEIPAHMSGKVINAPDLIPWIDIENLKRYPGIFEDGEHVVATEKIHGCLHGRVRVMLPDGSYRKIVDLVKENYRGNVLGMDKHGQVVETPVLATFDNGKTTDWIKVQVERRGIGRGSSFAAVTMTPNHRVYSPSHNLADSEGFVLGGQLDPGNEVWLHRSEITLSPLAEQVLIGKMLGDGHLSQGAVKWGHSATQRDYVAWTAKMLGPDLCSGTIEEGRVSGYGTPMARCSTRASTHIRELFADWITGDGKQVPGSIVGQLGPIAMAFWYMDDGSLTHHEDQEDRASLATNSFSETSIDNLVKALEHFGIGAVKYESSGWRLRLNSEAAERLFLLIAPYVPESMQYKLPERYRGGTAGFPRTFGTFKPTVRPQRVTCVTPVPNGTSGSELDTASPRGSTKYDMQTGVGNYFANGMLVHNSACLATLHVETGELWVSSKGVGENNLALEHEDTNLYWRAVKHYRVKEVLEEIAETFEAHTIALFGEVYGAGIQDLPYGKAASRDETLGYVAFDMAYINAAGQFWVNPRSFGAAMQNLGIPTPPILYRGRFNLEEIKKAASGPTVLGDGAHIREGIVIRPRTEGYSEILGGRKIAKLVSDEYLLRDGGTEYE